MCEEEINEETQVVGTENRIEAGLPLKTISEENSTYLSKTGTNDDMNLISLFSNEVLSCPMDRVGNALLLSYPNSKTIFLCKIAPKLKAGSRILSALMISDNVYIVILIPCQLNSHFIRKHFCIVVILHKISSVRA